MYDACSICSTIIPERLDPFINKYAEYTHDKWAFEKVQLAVITQISPSYANSYRLFAGNGYKLITSKKEAIQILLALTKVVIHIFMSVVQIQNNWSYGETLDENAKTHPMLRPYKTFSEKVGRQSHDALNLPVHSPQHFWCLNTDFSFHAGQRDLSMADQRVN